MLRRAALVAPLVAALPSVTRADPVDDLVRRAMARQHIPGAAVLVTQDDRVLKRVAYGEASLELHTPASPDHRFEIGSITKTVTATLVMRLVDAGQLTLRDSVGPYLADAPPAWRGITIEQLLSHTSGLRDYAFVPGLRLLERWTMQDWWTTMRTQPVDFAPGQDYAYSNTNYVLLGLIVERVSGRSMHALAEDALFQPLGMTHTRWGSGAAVIDGRAPGYLTRTTGIINRPPITETGYDGGLLSTVDDLATFERALRAGRVVRPATLARMRTAVRLPSGHRTPFGLGWWVANIRGHPMLSHGGQTAGYAATLAWFPDERLSVVLLTNLSEAGTDLLAREIAGVYAPELAVQTLAEAPDPDPALSATLLAGLHALASGQPVAPDLLDTSYAAKLATGRGRLGLAGLTPLKDATAMAFLESEPSPPDRILRYRVRGGGRTFVVAFVLTAALRLYALAAREESA